MLGPLKGVHLQSFQAELKRYNIWNGAVSSGKTFTTLLVLVLFCLSGPEGEILLIGKTERTLERNVIDPLKRIFGKGIRKVGSSVFIFGRRCYLVGANDERAEQKIRGISIVFALCDEMTLYPESFFQMLITRLRQKGAALVGTTNPDSPAHYLVSFMENPGNKDKLNVWFSTMDDNPYLEPGYVEDMKSAYPESSLWYKRYILGLWVAAEGVIYDMWDPAVHVVDKAPFDPLEEYVGVDYGTTNPTAFLHIGINHEYAYCMKEYYYDSSKHNRQKSDSEYADDMEDFLKGTHYRYVILDPSAASFKVELRKRGINVIDAKNDVLDGIRTVARMLSNRKYFVHSSCGNYIKEFSSYVWDDRSQRNGIDQPLKANDHAQDAGRYVIFTVLGKGTVQALRF